MNKNIKDIKKNAPYRSQLNPVKNIIFNAWFQERKSAKAIQRMLSENHNINVSLTCIYKFIRVRRKRPDPHDLPSFMQIQEQPEASVPVSREKPLATKQCKGGKPLTKEEQALIDKMMNQTKQEAYQEAVRLKMAKKKTQKP